MTRKKIKLAFIENQADRKASYKKRKKGLLKKVEELSTLCGIDACAIVYGPYDNEPEVWPSEPRQLQRVLTKFKDLPEIEKIKRMVTQEGFTKNRIEKLKEQLKKLQKDNREKEMSLAMYKCLGGENTVQNLGLADLNDMGWLINQNLKEINRRLAYHKKCQAQVAPPSAPITMVPAPETNINNGGDFNAAGSSVVVAAAAAAAVNIPDDDQMPIIDGQIQNLTWDMSMLCSTPGQVDLVGHFGWDDSFLPSILNNNGAGASNISMVNNIGAGPSNISILNNINGAGASNIFMVNNNGAGPSNISILNNINGAGFSNI